MELVNALADAYALNHSSVLPAYLQQFHQETLEKHPHAHLQSSLLQGSFLHFIVSLLKPQAVLEVGTFSGYSALCMAEAFNTSSAQLHTIELREADALAANQNFSKSIKNKQITLHLGNA
ncbi:MAG: O-methyltransferase, partial [Chitinophagaceae bacterium]